jgi:hypothetical protein
MVYLEPSIEMLVPREPSEVIDGCLAWLGLKDGTQKKAANKSQKI